MADRPEYLVGIEAEMSLAHEAVSQLHARLQAHQLVLQMLLEHLGIDMTKVEQWASAMANNDLPAMAEQSRLICQAIRRLPAR
ncbi:MAG TPA: hypothetical protein VFA23_15720 [Dongiaceae bacterium]|nr:hypothetical protein [Dongiaceae bacterium]